MTWIQGGPFLEVSFLIFNNGTRKEVLQEILNLMQMSKTYIRYENFNIDNALETFDRGYFYDPEETIIIHSIKFDFTANIGRSRKGIMCIHEICPATYLIDLCFYGSVYDAVEWNQIGIKQNEYPYFLNLLQEMYELYDYMVGGIAYEEDVTTLFKSDKCWPDMSYSIDNLDPIIFNERLLLTVVIWNEKIKQIDPAIKALHKYEILNNGGLLLFLSDWESGDI